MLDLLFSPNGRIGRAGFWKGALILFGIAIVVGLIAFALSRIIPGQPTTDGSYKVNGLAAIPFLALVFGYMALSLWSGICLGIKRYHDRGKSGAWILIQFVPLIGPIWYFVEAGCLAGTPGPNAYGIGPNGAAALAGGPATVF